MPCGDERTVGIATGAAFDEVFGELADKCGDSTEATDWRQRVEDAGVDFDIEALVIVWDWIGTQGQPSLAVEEPSPGVLAVALEWDIPSGPARPVATAACFCLAVDKTTVNQVNVNKAGKSLLSMTL